MPPKLKVVFDTNIYISAIIFSGPPEICLEAAQAGEIELYTSKTILLELANKLRSKFGYPEEDIEEILVGLVRFVKVVNPKVKINKIKEDPSDNMVLEAAVEAKGDLIVSGDKKHILPLKEFGGIKIISAAIFLKQL